MSDSQTLRAWLTSEGIQDTDFAQQLGISKSYLSQILSGARQARLELAIKIEEITGGAVPPRMLNVARPQSTENAEAAE